MVLKRGHFNTLHNLPLTNFVFSWTMSILISASCSSLKARISDQREPYFCIIIVNNYFNKKYLPFLMIILFWCYCIAFIYLFIFPQWVLLGRFTSYKHTLSRKVWNKHAQAFSRMLVSRMVNQIWIFCNLHCPVTVFDTWLLFCECR